NAGTEYKHSYDRRYRHFKFEPTLELRPRCHQRDDTRDQRRRDGEDGRPWRPWISTRLLEHDGSVPVRQRWHAGLPGRPGQSANLFLLRWRQHAILTFVSQ